ncbi:MAG TPA: class I SAM-dependent methyltransferase [Thermoplasmatales archaeon]|nr:class I SAM-dependent methyltransferase [Thermoplasmatales archaeon]
MEEWDKIAKDFDATRRFPWEECKTFLNRIQGKCIDIGCGNGRHLIPAAEKCDMVVGLDISIKMLEMAHRNMEKSGIENVMLVMGDARHLPFPDNFFDGILFIASLHNIKGKKERKRALEEVRRVLKPGGRALISVWAKWQDRWRKYFLLHPLKGDIHVPWRRGAKAIRFYHLYSMREFKGDIRKAGLKIERAWSVKKASKKYPDNHFAVVRK